MNKAMKQFLAVAETGSISAACERLNVTQPTITVGIKKLEEEYGLALFERTSRGMILTDAGAILRDHAQVIARLEDHAYSQISSLRRSERTSIRIGCGFAWWPLFLRDFVKAYIEEVPEANIHAGIFNSYDGLTKLLLGDISLFIGHEVPELSRNTGLEFEALFDIEDSFFVRTGHPLLGGACSLEDMEPYDTVDSVPFELAHRGLLERFADNHQAPSAPLHEHRTLSSNSMTACLDMLRFSDAIIRYPASSESYFAAQGCARLTVSNPPEPNTVGMYMLQERKGDEKIMLLREQIRKAACA